MDIGESTLCGRAAGQRISGGLTRVQQVAESYCWAWLGRAGKGALGLGSQDRPAPTTISSVQPGSKKQHKAKLLHGCSLRRCACWLA
eukprot:3598248-Amphidinium_carterae.1